MIGTGGVIIFADEDDSDSLRGFNDTGGDTELFPDDDDNGTAENPTGLALLIDDDDVDDDGNFVGSLFGGFFNCGPGPEPEPEPELEIDSNDMID